MIQRSEDFGFAFKPGEPVWVFCERLRQDFEGHVPVEVGISRPIHVAYPTLTDEGGDVVMAE